MSGWGRRSIRHICVSECKVRRLIRKVLVVCLGFYASMLFLSDAAEAAVALENSEAGHNMLKYLLRPVARQGVDKGVRVSRSISWLPTLGYHLGVDDGCTQRGNCCTPLLLLQNRTHPEVCLVDHPYCVHAVAYERVSQSSRAFIRTAFAGLYNLCAPPVRSPAGLLTHPVTAGDVEPIFDALAAQEELRRSRPDVMAAVEAAAARWAQRSPSAMPWHCQRWWRLLSLWAPTTAFNLWGRLSPGL